MQPTIAENNVQPTFRANWLRFEIYKNSIVSLNMRYSIFIYIYCCSHTHTTNTNTFIIYSIDKFDFIVDGFDYFNTNKMWWKLLEVHSTRTLILFAFFITFWFLDVGNFQSSSMQSGWNALILFSPTIQCLRQFNWITIDECIRSSNALSTFSQEDVIAE